MTERQKFLKKRMLKRCKKMIAECEQIIIDATCWNSINPQHPPIDVERERVTIHLLREFEKELLANDGEPLDVEGRLARVMKTLRSA